ncbi:MAG: ribokinase [Pseudomonadota bacterium]
MLTVFGSINLDLVLSAKRAPEAGETLHGRAPQRFPGGKGANQALAAARTGAEVQMAGAVGRDGEAEIALSNLTGSVDLSAVQRVETPTSLAVIIVEDGGENRILVCDGANMTLTAGDAPPVGSGTILLLQNEIPAEARHAAIAAAAASGARVMLNPSPIAWIRLGDVAEVDTLIVNRAEALALSAKPNLEEALQVLTDAGPSVVVTLGPEGALWTDGRTEHRAAGQRVDAVDTTGAGDTFAGSFAARRARGASVPDALMYANSAAALACTAMGAQSAIPSEEDVRAFMASRD